MSYPLHIVVIFMSIPHPCEICSPCHIHVIFMVHVMMCHNHFMFVPQPYLYHKWCALHVITMHPRVIYLLYLCHMHIICVSYAWVLDHCRMLATQTSDSAKP